MADVWHPVSEEPPREAEYLVCVTEGSGHGLCWAFYLVVEGQPAWYTWDANMARGEDNALLEGVTHWAEITYPTPPEEA